MAIVGKEKPIKQKRKKDNSLHEELCDKAEKWLKQQHYLVESKKYLSSCSVILKEMVSMSPEQPDCIGFNSSFSVLIECKTSRSDFKKDFKKIFRLYEYKGMGNFRFYLTLPGLLKPTELLEGWGLLELNGNKIKIIRESGYFSNTKENEYPLLFSALRRKY